MTNEMKLEIAKLRADGYEVEVIINKNIEEYERYSENFIASLALMQFGCTPYLPRTKESFYTTEFKVTK